MGGAIEEQFNTLFSWYEMWINPDKLTINTEFLNKKEHTAGSIVTYHFRKDAGVMSASGQCGWIMIQSDMDKLKDLAMKGAFTKSSMSSAADFGKQILNQAGLTGSKKGGKTFLQNYSTYAGKSVSLDNSPRTFLKRLRELAEEPMYFYDADGVEHYNTKFIKIFTKQYPDGVICEGYYKKFSVPETSDDVQTIDYNFDFIIENYKQIGLIERTLGMFSGAGSAVGEIIRTIGV
jgi:hypothetical protein